MTDIHITEPVPSKKNRYEVRLSKPFLSALMRSGLLKAFPGVKWWVAPARAVEDFELMLAWEFKRALRDYGGESIELNVVVGGKRQDLDNVLGCILDALQKSGRIANDKQVREIHVCRNPEVKGVVIEVS